MTVTLASSFRRIDVAELRKALQEPDPPLVLDVRLPEMFADRPERLPGAVPLVLDYGRIRIPEVDRSRPIVAYCRCNGETTSSRMARWLVQSGYRDVAVLSGGLGAWADAGYPLEPIDLEADATAVAWKDLDLALREGAMITPDNAFLWGQGFLDGRELPMRREMALVFVDMVESTELVLHRPPEEVLAILQTFMEVVIDVGWYFCGDVHDFEGDGAMLYFQGTGEALPAAFRLRDELLRRSRTNPQLPLPRVSLDVGPVVIGVVGTRFRQTISLVGPAVHRAARILKLAPPGGIVATEPIIEHARRSEPELGKRFGRMTEDFVLDRRHPNPAPLWVAPPVAAAAEIEAVTAHRP
jgi:class 3 adenylate cyclase/rhodanese-related sulfurtransferase